MNYKIQNMFTATIFFHSFRSISFTIVYQTHTEEEVILSCDRLHFCRETQQKIEKETDAFEEISMQAEV